MGDLLLFDDFDVDALLDAQSSDGDDSELPELERSLDDILNDAEFEDILGVGASSSSSRHRSKTFVPNPRVEEDDLPLKSSSSSNPSANNGGLEGEGEGEGEGEAVEIARSGVEYQNGEKKVIIITEEDKISAAGGHAEDDGEELIEQFSASDDALNSSSAFENASRKHHLLGDDDGDGLSAPAGIETPPSQSARSRSLPGGGGVEDIAASKRIDPVSGNLFGGSESNGKSVGAMAAAAVIAQPPHQLTKARSRPGAAFAAAVAASRQSFTTGSQHSSSAAATSRFGKSTSAPAPAPQQSSSFSSGVADKDVVHHQPDEADENFGKENSILLSQSSDDVGAAVQQNPSSSKIFEVGAGRGDFRDSGGRILNDDRLDSGNDQSTTASREDSGIIQLNGDEEHAETMADLTEEVEVLSTLVSQLHSRDETSSASTSDTSEGEVAVEMGDWQQPVSGSGRPLSVIVSDGESYDTAPGINDEVGEGGGGDGHQHHDVGSGVMLTNNDFESDPAAEAEAAGPAELELDSPGVISLNNWIGETEDQVITTTTTTGDEAALNNNQLRRVQSLGLRRDSIHRHAVQQVLDDLEETQNEVGAKDEEEMEVEMAMAALPAAAVHEELQQRTPLQIAEEHERNAASTGLDWEEGAVAQPMRLEGIQRGAPAIGLLQVDSGGSLSYPLQSSALRREHGVPQALGVHSNFIAVGLSKGGVLVIPSRYSATHSADETDAKAFFLATGGPEKSVSSMSFNQQGDLLLVGFSNGHLVLWDVPKANVVKTLEKEHSVAILHTLFVGQDIPGARTYKFITCDSKGLTLAHTFGVVPVLRRFTVNTLCLMDGQRTGIPLSISPLLPEEGPQTAGGSSTTLHGSSSGSMNLSTVMGVVGATGGDVGRKFLYDGSPSTEESAGGLVVFVTNQVALVVRMLPSFEVCAKLTRPEGIREGAIPYTAWRRTKLRAGAPAKSSRIGTHLNQANGGNASVSGHRDADSRRPESAQNQEEASTEGPTVNSNGGGESSCPSLAIVWDRKVLIYQLPKSELKIVAQWELDSPASGVAWLEEHMMVVATSNDQLCLFTDEGVEVEREGLGSEQGNGIGEVIYHTHIMNLYGNPERAYHNALAVRGAALYLLGPNRLWRARLLPWRDRIKALENAGDWMGAFHIAMELYDGRSEGVTGLPNGLDAMHEAIMPTLLALLSSYIDEAFAYLSLARGPSSSQVMKIVHEPVDEKDHESSVMHDLSSNLANGTAEASEQEMDVEAREQYARVGGVAIEFCVHIGKTEVLFENVFSKFEAVGQRGTFLELLEPYILKDMLGGLAPEVMQALVDHYSGRGWLNRVEQCVLHMDIGSLDFNQVVRVCRENGLYSALIYLFTKGLDDFKSPMEELLTVAQDSTHPSEAKAFGYKLLVYLKYCFTGLAFPPGNGALPSSSLPKLRTELLSYVLDPVDRGQGRAVSETSVQELYPRLLYLLKLDTQATLLVLGAAFPEQGPLGVGTRDWIYLGIVSKPAQRDGICQLQSESTSNASPSEDSMKDGLKLAQQTVDAIIHILSQVSEDGKASESEAPSISTSTSTSSNDQWPSGTDRGDMLEFVAHFAAGNYAAVTGVILPQILDHLVSPPAALNGSGDLERSGRKGQMMRRRKEDLMVALLRAVPESEWDAQRTLQIAQRSGYWQVTALLHAKRSDYTAALDSYLKDTSRPQHPFTFIGHMLSSDGGLEGERLSSFHETVLSRLPELIGLSTVSTVLVVLKHFSNENERILRELAPHPKLQFNYLKAVMNVRSSCLDIPSKKEKVDSALTIQSIVREQFDGDHETGGSEITKGDDANSDTHSSTLTDLLQRSGLEITNEMAETFVKLLCNFEPKAVLPFLERYDFVRLEHCLNLCLEYGITDAAAFLLERLGDVANALSLVLAGVHKSMKEMDHAIAQLINTSSLGKEHSPDAVGDKSLKTPEVVAVHSILSAAVALCQRNTFRLANPQESESLWFRLLDRFVEPLHNLNEQMKWSGAARKQQQLAKKGGAGATKQQQQHPDHYRARKSKSSRQWEVLGSDPASKLLRKAFVNFIGDIVSGMMGYVPLPVIMNKILDDHRGHEFGDFKGTILDMLSEYGYERAILGTAKQLIEDDAFQKIIALKRGFTHAFSPAGSTCIVCERRLDEPGLAFIKSRNSESRPTDSNKEKDYNNNKADTSKGKAKEEEGGGASTKFQHNHQQQEQRGAGIRIFPCGHATHLSCMDAHSGSAAATTSSSTMAAAAAAACPACSCESKAIDASWRSRDSSLLNNGVIEVGAAAKARPHDSIYASSQGSTYKMTHQVFGRSRLELLRQLENGTELHELGVPLKLNLAPSHVLHRRANLPRRRSTLLTGGPSKPSLATSSKRR